MKEFDFRFAGLDPLADPHRVRILRNLLLELAGGFTEVRPGRLEELIVGPGLGYIVNLADLAQAADLAYHLSDLALRWGISAPSLVEASRGPRNRYAFFLVPKLANRDARGPRRALFPPKRWAELRRLLRMRLSHPVELVYGEWQPADSARVVDHDLSYAYFFRLAGSLDRKWLRSFILTHVFDGGRACDQEAIYLSIAGAGELIVQPEI